MAQTSHILVEPHLIDADFRKAWMPFFYKSKHPVVTVEQFLSFVDLFLPQEPVLDLSRITGQDLSGVARAEKSTAGGLDGWAWNEIRSLPLAWFCGLAILLHLVETAAVWPQGLLVAYINMIPEVDGDSTPLGSALPLCSPCYTQTVDVPSGLLTSRIGSRAGFLSLSLV